ncbi:hypothetical protein GE253_20435 [Niveispirillum sp. SYP-B3756]|uniref:hypothetical protein n=1 Tax=Niveispirillum sp. SYP-B3756 TaxID=2662178 RepID=UPI0012916231|nr:hypothetical protein [Niveispirillum sp. SYP-B3756]MQP67701.1 hypothetical protein [Niveispirillum sp. SYP-B3756]
MSDVSSPALYALAAKIAISYARTHTVPADALPGVIQQAFRGLTRCTQPVTATPVPAKKMPGRVGRPRKS